MTTPRERGRVETLRNERDRAAGTAVSVAMVGLLVGLCAFFVCFAPHL